MLQISHLSLPLTNFPELPSQSITMTMIFTMKNGSGYLLASPVKCTVVSQPGFAPLLRSRGGFVRNDRYFNHKVDGKE